MEAFKIKNGLSAKRYLGSTTTLSGSTIDLSLGSMFSTTLSSDPAYTFTNPPASGNAQAFSVEVTGGTTTFTQDSFATTLYTGTSATQTITNGLDLSGDGGLVWIKSRGGNYSQDHSLIDTARGATTALSSNTTGGNSTQEYSFGTGGSFNNNGFTIASTSNQVNTSSADAGPYVAWAFKKQAKFFDIVTYTGTGVSGLTVSHSLGGTVGSMFVKCTSHADDWYVYHIETGATHSSFLNTTAAAAANGAYWNNTAPTTTAFTVGDNAGVNASGRTYVAYLFAHDTASDSRVKCGSYTGNGAATGVLQDLGWQPQWLLIKNTDLASEQWFIFDSVRGVVTGGSDAYLEASRNVNEANANIVDFATNGFTPISVDDKTNGSGHSYIYMAIRGNAATDSAITWPSSVKWPSGVAPTTPAPGTKDLFTFLTTNGGTTYYGKKAAEGLA
jgi:hypothetical protein